MIFLSFLILLTTTSAKAELYEGLPHPQLQASVTTWFQTVGLPQMLRNQGVDRNRFISSSYSVGVKRVILPPDLGGPRPGTSTKVLVRGSIRFWPDHYWRYSHEPYHSGWDRHATSSVECRFEQEMLAKTNKKSVPVELIGGQKIRVTIFCLQLY
ncbi:MAG: hypothetical protein M9962_00885 [Oligoflexia bacterium]|nr:hypothetical protein [Oligoflexia bacterium]